MNYKKILFLALSFITISSYAQEDIGKKDDVKVLIVKNNIYMLQGKGGNIGICTGPDGVFMIDDQYAEGIDEVQDDIKSVSKKPIQFLVNTHHHGDHTGGNATLAKNGTLIFAQENVRKRLMALTDVKTDDRIEDKALPIVTFSEDMTFYYNNEKIFVFHVHNAHTDGDSMVYFINSNVLHTGDVFFNGKYPYIDLENGGSLKGYIEGLNRILLVSNKDTKIIPGHGDVGTVEDVKYTVNMLAFLEKKIEYYYVSGKTEAQILQMKDLTKKFDDKGYGKGFITTEKMLQTIYKEVAKERGPIETKSMEERMQEQKDKMGIKDTNEKNKN